MSETTHFSRRTFLAGVMAATTRPAMAADALRLSELVARRGDSPADSTAALAAALRKAVEEQRPLLVDGRFAIGHDIPVPGPVKILGRKDQGDGFDLLPAPASVGGGNHGHLMFDAGKSIDGVSFEDLTFKGGFDAARYEGSKVVPVVRMSPHSGVVHRNIEFRRCQFIDPVNSCIVAAPDMGGSVEALQVIHCEVDVTVALDRASRTANLLQCILAYIDWPGHKSSYGTVAVKGVKVDRCRARGVRTLADLKRGTSDFEVTDCKTVDMNDCHHSADGAAHGLFARLEGVQKSRLVKAKNFIEVQGEDIEIRDFRYEVSPDAGAIAGIMITPYAFPVEGRGATHQSRKIRIFNGQISGLSSHAAVRLINAAQCQVRGIVVDDVKSAAVAVENPPDGLTPDDITIEDVKPGRGRGVAGVSIAPSARGVKVRRVSGFDKTTVGGGRAEP